MCTTPLPCSVWVKVARRRPEIPGVADQPPGVEYKQFRLRRAQVRERGGAAVPCWGGALSAEVSQPASCCSCCAALRACRRH